MFYVLGLFVDDFVLVSDYSSKKIYQISLKNADVAALNLTIVTNPLGLAWNSRSQHIFWSDGPRSQIHKARLDGSNYSIVANPGICFSFFFGKKFTIVLYNYAVSVKFNSYSFKHQEKFKHFNVYIPSSNLRGITF